MTVTVINTGNRNVAAVAPLNDKQFLRLTTPVRQNITTATRDDSRTTLDIVNLETGEVTLAGVVPENPVVNVFGTTRFNTNPRQMVVDSAGTTAYAITLSGPERGFADADRDGHAARDQHRRARHREFGGRHAELPAGLVHHDHRHESGGAGDGGHRSRRRRCWAAPA